MLKLIHWIGVKLWGKSPPMLTPHSSLLTPSPASDWSLRFLPIGCPMVQATLNAAGEEARRDAAGACHVMLMTRDLPKLSTVKTWFVFCYPRGGVPKVSAN